MVKIFSIQKTTLQDFPGKVAAIVFLAGCNLRCIFCHNPAAINGNENVSVQDFFSFLESRKGKLQGIVLSGGEPTIHSDLVDFISRIKQMGFLVKLDTNGTNPEMLQKLLKKGFLDYVAMDVKAPFSRYREITGSKDVTSKIKQSIRLLLNDKIDYEFRTTCHPSLSRSDFRVIASQIKGAKRYFLQQYVDAVTLNPQKHLAVYNEEALQSLQKEFKDEVQEVRIR
ncbi:anaerobic ribonucleoside-triphosphate reductase activating protein [Candidatus Micrarchaeota archaeon]|nr:anaerobic ribonucleoside-triphosphate reductase activating protein [Candidatus Micrarchaeota archaeon]MBU1930386.1 anaerobic ribonucleoside-triphosphate reductase activating protein [Candidatus Micrarchaeota archaeon]